MKIIWSDQATFSWQKIADYIYDEFGYDAMLNFREETLENESRIAEFPNIGTTIVSVKHKEVSFKYVLISRLSKMIYHADGEKIIIDLFWDTRMNPKTLIKHLQGK